MSDQAAPVPSQLLIMGAGGHSKVVADTALAAGYTILGFVDDLAAEAPLPGFPVLGKMDDLASLLNRFPGAETVVAVGDNAVRRRLALRAEQAGAVFATVVHPGTVISPYARIGRGTVVMAGVAVNAGARVDEHVILNTACSVDHDCAIGSFSHLSPGVHLAGTVIVGEGAHLGVGTAVIPGCAIGPWSVVGAGSAVVRDIPSRTVAYGVPARPARSLQGGS